VFAAAAAMSASASALVLPLVLPRQATWTGDSTGEPQLISLAGTVTCTASKAEGTEEEQELAKGKHSLGLYHITFTGCKSSGVACNSKGDVKETILTLGLWHLVYDKFSAKENDTEANLGVAILFKVGGLELTSGEDPPPDLVLECAGGLVKITILGQVLCLVLEYKTKSKKKNFHCIANKEKPDVAEEKEYFNGEDKENNPVKISLLCAKAGGKEEECAELALGLVDYKEEVVIDG
jgi:hypothetical protein